MHKVLLASLLLLSACSPELTRANESSNAATPSSTSTSTPERKSPQHVFPGFNARLPLEPEGAGNALIQLHQRLPKVIEEWLRAGGNRDSFLGREVHRGALWQQRLYRRLTQQERWSRRVLAGLRGPVKAVAKRHIAAQRGLSHLTSPVKPSSITWKVYEPESPHRLLNFYRAGQRRYDVPWQVLASINAVETRFGRILGPSSAGAMGPMQFMPATWDAYGRGDINDPHDSIIAAARYLSASGAPERMRDALFAYNRSTDYVNAILTYAREMQRDPRSYYGYYHWEVFVHTTKGDLQYTGPGADK